MTCPSDARTRSGATGKSVGKGRTHLGVDCRRVPCHTPTDSSIASASSFNLWRGQAISSALPLFDEQTNPLEVRFRQFHAENPEVYVELARLAREAKGRGRSRYGIGALFEILRWSRMQTNGGEFKCDNRHRAYYARLLMEREPDLAGFFETRATAAERDDDSEAC